MPSVQIVDFMRESNMGWNFFLKIFVHTLEGHRGRFFEPKYKVRA